MESHRPPISATLANQYFPENRAATLRTNRSRTNVPAPSSVGRSFTRQSHSQSKSQFNSRSAIHQIPPPLTPVAPLSPSPNPMAQPSAIPPRPPLPSGPKPQIIPKGARRPSIQTPTSSIPGTPIQAPRPIPAIPIVLKIHIVLPQLDVWKKLRFETRMMVRDALRIICERANLINNQSFQLFCPDSNGRLSTHEGTPMEEGAPLLKFNLKDDGVLLLQLRPQADINSGNVTVISMENQEEIFHVNFAEQGAELLKMVCSRFNLQGPEKYNLQIPLPPPNAPIPILCIEPLKEQGVTTKSIIEIHKKSKSEVRRLRTSIASIQKRLEDDSRGSPKSYTLQAIQDYPAEHSRELALKKGDKIMVLEEDDSGWWRGKIGERVGIFPVTHCKYLSIDSGENSGKVKDEIDKGLTKFGTKRGVPTMQRNFLMRTLFRKKGKKDPFEGYGFERYNDTLPLVVRETLEQLNLKEAFKVEGVFRVSGNLKDIHAIRRRYDRGKSIDISNYNIHTISGILKLFFRELPEPLFTFELYQCFVSAVRIADPKGRLYCIKQGLSVLPPGNLAIVTNLFSFFKKQTLHSDTSKMTAYSLAVIFAPSLIRPEVETVDTIMTDDTKTFIEILIREYPRLFLEENFGKGTVGKTQFPQTPEFDTMLAYSSEKISESLKSERNTIRLSQNPIVEIQRNFASDSSTSMPSNSTSSSDGSVDEVQIRDLVECIIEGNTASVEQYIESLPRSARDSKRSEVFHLFQSVVNPKSPRAAHVPNANSACSRCESGAQIMCENCHLAYCGQCSDLIHQPLQFRSHLLTTIQYK